MIDKLGDIEMGISMDCVEEEGWFSGFNSEHSQWFVTLQINRKSLYKIWCFPKYSAKKN